MIKRIGIVCFVLMTVLAGLAQEKDALLIYGNGWMFGLTEPKGWVCHTQDAYRYHMNAYFCLGKTNIDRSPAIMHVSVYGKGGDSLDQSLSFDIENYRKHSKTLDLQEFPIEKSDYDLVSKKYVIDDKTADYVCFLDPGKDATLYLVFVLHGPKDESVKYEEVFRSLIRSLTWMGSGSPRIKK